MSCFLSNLYMVEVLKNYNTLLLVALALLFSCDYKDNEVAPASRFVQYIDVQTGDDEILPLSMITTDDGGFLVLGILNQSQPYVIKLNQLGMKAWEYSLPAPYNRPIPELIKVGASYYFVTSNTIGAESSYLFKVDDMSGSVSMEKEIVEVQYPLAISSVPSGGMLLQSYDAEGRRTVIQKFDAAFDQVWRKRFDIYEDLEDPAINNHINRNTQPLPFFNGTVTNASGEELYHYFNGFSNYTFATTFINKQGEETGAVLGNRYEALLSAACLISDGVFAFSRFEQDGTSFLVGRAEVSPSEYSQGTQLVGDRVVNWEDRSPVFCGKLTISGVDYIGFVGNTLSGKVELRLYSQDDGSFRGSEFFGSDYFTGHAKFVQTDDGGLAILAQAAIEDKFFKLVIYKFSEESLIELLD